MSHFEIQPRTTVFKKTSNVLLRKHQTQLLKICCCFVLLFLAAFQAKASTSATTQRTPAAINQAALLQVTPNQVFSSENGKPISPELIATYNQIKALDKPLDVTQLIPMDMTPTDDSSEVFSKVADKSATTFFNSPAVRATSLGQTATSVEKSLKQELVLGQAQSIQHKFNFNFQAFQSLAQMQYTGITNAVLKYKANELKVALEIFEKLQGGKDLVLSHTISPADRISQLSLRWKF